MRERFDLQGYVQQVKDRVEIETVIGRYVQLERAGTRLKGLCPFHAEKTPSFYVSPDRQFFKCFGCDEGGDVLHFLRLIEGLDFLEALRQLASEAGLPWPSRFERGRPEDRSLRDQAQKALIRAVELYHEALRGPEGAAARAYLEERGVEPAMWEAFRLGWAPDDPRYLVSRLRREGFAPAALETAGLARSREGAAPSDFFRERLLFPVFRSRGYPVGFGGRYLPGSWAEEKGLGKYVNSPDTPLFRKQQLLYALERLPAETRGGSAGEPVLLAEGFLDVVLLHQAGLRTALGALGTAFTEHHARRLARRRRPVVLLLDGDAAGEEGAARAGLVLVQEGVDTRICPLPAGEDPADLVASGRAGELSRRVREARDILEWRLEAERRRSDFSLPAVRSAVARRLAAWIEATPDPVLAEVWTRRVCDGLGIGEGTLRRLLRPARTAAAPSSEASSPSDLANAGPAPSATERLSRNERELVLLLLHDPSLHALFRDRISALLDEEWADPSALSVLKWQIQERNQGRDCGPVQALAAFPEDRRFLWLDQGLHLSSRDPRRDLERALTALPANREAWHLECRAGAEPTDEDLRRLLRRVDLRPGDTR